MKRTALKTNPCNLCGSKWHTAMSCPTKPRKQLKRITEEQIAEIKRLAEEHKGHCPTCHQVIKIYTYPVNNQMMKVLRAMRGVVEDTGINEVNFDDFDLPYSLKTQRTKLRLHGLIARVKDPKTDKQKKNTWLITEKGGRALRGEPIPAKVEVYNNQLIGHKGGEVTFKQMPGDSTYQEKEATPAEAEVFGDVRSARRNVKVLAEYLRPSNYLFDKDKVYELTIDRLQVGKPLVILSAPESRLDGVIQYDSMADFMNQWKVVEKR